MDILLTFVGRNDRKIFENDGPIKGVLNERSYDRVFLFYNNTHEFLPIASDVLKYCQKHHPETKVEYREALSVDPTDYNVIYPLMVAAVQEIKKECPKAKYTISVSSGTPTMHTCWLMIVQGKILDAELIQVSREKGIHPIRLELDDFPKIKAPSAAKARMTQLSRENQMLRENILTGLDSIIGKSSTMLELKEQIARFAKTELPIFIHGETGTGKELVAKAIHLNSDRAEGHFEPVNCGAIPQNLIESELFGHKKGAFTGAIEDKKGAFQEAHKGTLFLDEIGDLPLEAQSKLLRAIQEKKVKPVGSTKYVDTDVRIVSASLKDLNLMIGEGTFRQDLFYRVVGKILYVVSLRERKEDIILLADHFLKQLNDREKTNKSFSKAALKKLKNYLWPGNVRELERIVEVAFILAGDKIESEHIDFIKTSAKSPSGYSYLIPPEGIDLNNELLPEIYQQAMDLANGVAADAARLLRLEPHTFRARMNKVKE